MWVKKFGRVQTKPTDVKNTVRVVQKYTAKHK